MCNDFAHKRKKGENREISQTSQCLQFTQIKKNAINEKKVLQFNVRLSATDSDNV